MLLKEDWKKSDTIVYYTFASRSVRFFFALRPEHIQKHTYWIFVPFPTIPPPPVELRNRKSEIEKNSTLGFKIVHFLFQISTQIIKIRWLKNEKLYASHLSFFRFAFLFVSDRFSAYASQWILKCVGGRSDIIEVLLDCVAYFCLRCCWTAFVLESLAFKAPTKGEKQDEKNGSLTIDNYRFSTFSSFAPASLLSIVVPASLWTRERAFSIFPSSH